MPPTETSTQVDEPAEPAGEPTTAAAKPAPTVAMTSQELGFKDPKKEQKEKEVKKVSAEDLDWWTNSKLVGKNRLSASKSHKFVVCIKVTISLKSTHQFKMAHF